MPSARAIHWTPVRSRPRSVAEDGRGYAIFVTQGALRDIAEHVWMAPEQELLGFLLGELGEDPETGERYIVISVAMRTEYAIPEDAAVQIPDELWHAVHLEARLRRATLLGWYHSSPYLNDFPTLFDRETHRRQFPEPWMAGLVVVPDALRPDGGFFRAGGSAADAAGGGGTFLPFYELLDDDARLIAGRKPTVIGWESYRADDTVVRPVVSGLGTRDSGLEDEEAHDGLRAPGTAGFGAQGFGMPAQGTPGGFPVLFPPEAYEETPPRRSVGSGQRVAFFAGSAALVAASILAVATLARWAPSSEPADAPIPMRAIERGPSAVPPPVTSTASAPTSSSPL
ncbi:MAG: Mov34/MPN/PAD-1 family protein, partial [Chloroflexota bacterium]|nr:Mov34/MPN/PAD-1 family protein [Chloroflexota bacterium]